MEIAVYDTYVKTSDGTTVHFDVLLPKTNHSLEKAIMCAKDYLNKEKIVYASISSEECQLCHFEKAEPEHLSNIQHQGYSIIRMEDIPPQLPPNPTRRQMILYLRAKYPELRFHNFSTYSTEEIRKLIQQKRIIDNEFT